ncbi:MAG: TetR/AcrR family transcriptional regulator [Alphaproteobacteria bacterium]
MKLPLRERKKIETRRRIAEVANSMFREQGFAGTTLDQIADQSNIHKITVLRYFPTKEAIAFAAQDDIYLSFKEELNARLGPVLDTWRGHIFRNALAATHRQELILRNAFVVSDPALLSYQLRLDARYQRTLARAFAEEAGVDPETDIFGRALAGLLVAGNHSVAQMALRHGDYSQLQASCMAVVDLGAEFQRTHFHGQPLTQRPTPETAPVVAGHSLPA